MRCNVLEGNVTAGPPFLPTCQLCNVWRSLLLVITHLQKESSAQPNSIKNILLREEKYSLVFVYIYSRQMKCIN